jgi:hypothetical protein
MPCHNDSEYASNEDGDGFHEIYVNTTESFWVFFAFLTTSISRYLLRKVASSPEAI